MKKKSLLKSIITFMLVIAMFTGVVPLPGLTMEVRAAETIHSDFTATAGTGGAGVGEGKDSLVDGNKGTKWCVTSLENPTYIEFNSTNSITPTGYILTTGGDTADYPGRNPASWTIKAKNTGDTDWTTLATVTDDTVLQAANTTDYRFALNNSTAYQYFRFEINSIKGGNVFQLAEFQFISGVDLYHDLTNGTLTGTSFYKYTGSAITPVYTVKTGDGTTLTKDTDYTVAITKDGNTVDTVTEKGDYVLTVTGKSPFTGSKTLNFTVDDGYKYLKADGNEQTCGDFTVLTGGGAATLSTGWYVVNSDITYTDTITIDGDVHIILVDGRTMAVNAGNQCFKGNNTSQPDYPADVGSLTIYAQSTGDSAGQLTATSNSQRAVAIQNLTINGGQITFSRNEYETVQVGGTLTFNGGNVAVTGGRGRLYANTLKLNWNNTSDTLYAKEYGGNHIIADKDWAYRDGGGMLPKGEFSEDHRDQIQAALADKTIVPFPNITKYVPGNKEGEYTIPLPALPDGAKYYFTKTDTGSVINNLPEGSDTNTLTFTTYSEKDGGTSAAITVEAKGAASYIDYSFTVSVIVSEYTVAYEWPAQTNIYLIGNDWAFCETDQTEKPYHDNELVWSESGVTLDTLKIAISGGTPSNVVYQVNGTVLTAGENTLVLTPGEYHISITGDGLDDWVEFKVIKLVEDENFAVTVSDVARFIAPEEAEEQRVHISGGGTGYIAECKPDMKATLNGEDVTNSGNITLWYRSNGYQYDDEDLYQNDTYRTPGRGIIGDGTEFPVGYGASPNMTVYNIKNGSAALDGINRIDTVCGQLVLHREGEEIRQKLDLDDNAVSSGASGGYVYYVGTDCPDFYLKDGKVYYKDKTGDHLAEEKKTYTDGKDIFYAGGETIYQYNGFIGFGSCMFTLKDTAPVPLCESRKNLGHIIGMECNCPKDWEGNCTECISQNGDMLTVCGETFEMGSYIYVGSNCVFTGSRAIYNIVPSEEYTIGAANISTEINGSIITIDGKYSIDAGDRPILKGTVSLNPQPIGNGVYYPCAYARYETAPYCYLIARGDFMVEVRRSEVSIVDCKSEYKTGEDVEFKIATCSYKYSEDKGIYKGSTGDINIYLNNERKGAPLHFSESNKKNDKYYHEVNFDQLPEGTYTVRAELDNDEGYQGAITTATFRVVRNDPQVTLTGKQNTAGEAFADGADIEYDPENLIAVNAVNDKAVSDTYWKWQISGTSDADVVKMDHTVNESGNNAINREDLYLKTLGIGTVTLKAGFSGNYLYKPAKGAITFRVVPKQVTSPIIEVLDEDNLYYTGGELKPDVNVYYAEGKLIPEDEYEVTYDNNIHVSTGDSKAKVIIKSKEGSRYSIDAEQEFVIKGVRMREKPVAGAITYGQTLGDSTLTGGVAEFEGTVVPGTFAWADSSVKPSVSDSESTEYEVIFTPTDTDYAQYGIDNCKVKLTVNKADIPAGSVTAPVAKTDLSYNDQAQELVEAGTVSGNIGTVYYAVTDSTVEEAPEFDGTSTEADKNWNTSLPAAKNAGTYYVWYKSVGDENHNDIEAALVGSVTIAKGKSITNAPKATMDDVLYTNKKVSDVSLPDNWDWDDIDRDKELTVGVPFTATAIYTGTDKANYETECQSVTVTITRNACTHPNLSEHKTEAVAATCTTAGNREYYTCADCGECFSDKTGTTVIEEGSKNIAALGHSLTKTDAKAAICETAGNSEYYTCSRCGKYFSDKDGKTEIAKDSWVIAAKKHNYGTPTYTWSDDNKTCTAEKVCTRSGCTENTEGHKVTETVNTTSKVTKAASCTAKGTTTYTATFTKEGFVTQTKDVNDIPELGHNYKTPTYTWSEDGKTCEAKAVCANDETHVVTEKATVSSEVTKAATCKDKGTTTYSATFTNSLFKTQTKAVDDIAVLTTHTWDNGVITTAPTCETKGVKTFTCSVCGQTRTEEVEALGHTHTLVKVDAKAATCKAVGNIEYWTCSGCGKYFSDSNGTTEIDKEDIVVAKAAHTPATAVKENEVAATCEEAGSYDEVIKCSVCGEEISREKVTVPATGHDWGEWKTIKYPTETAEGLEERICKNDVSHTETRSIEKLESKPVIDEKDKPSDGEKPSTSDKPSTGGTPAVTDNANTSDTPVATDSSKLIETPAAKDTTLTDETNKVTFIVTSSSGEEPAVEYKALESTTDKTVTIPDSVTINGITYKITEIADDAFANNKTVEKIVIGNNIETIGNGAFSGCTALKTISLPNSVKEIGDGAFNGCTSLKKVAIPDSVTEIGVGAFNGCKKLTSMTVGKNVKKVGDGAFANCTSIKTVTLSAKTTTLGKQVFKGDKKLKTIIIMSKKLTSKTIAKNAFKGLGDKVTIKVPKGKKEAYTKLFRKKGLSKKVIIK